MRAKLERAWLPRLIVALSTVRWPRRVLARLTRRGHVRLFVAFDDPYSAVALLGLTEIVAGRRVTLEVEPVVERGIPGDPAVDAKRAYAVVDAGRLAERAGLRLSRSAPLAAADTAFLAGWTAAIDDATERRAFAAAAMRRLWLESSGDVDRAALSELWRRTVGGEPRAAPTSERAFRRRGLYDTPVAVVHGEWFFAHERLPQIADRLAELGFA